jgi:hypothetical protein
VPASQIDEQRELDEINADMELPDLAAGASVLEQHR